MIEKEVKIGDPFKPYRVVTENGINYVYYNGEKLPFIVDTVITQLAEDCNGDAYVKIQLTLFGRMVDSKPINQQNDEKSN